ncbi:hypothetical protein L0F63_006234 [Massospora cicadina]|nr:hypothetical protein L0F63_006234 [Massospora cicadina]
MSAQMQRRPITLSLLGKGFLVVTSALLAKDMARFGDKIALAKIRESELIPANEDRSECRSENLALAWRELLTHCLSPSLPTSPHQRNSTRAWSHRG